MKKIILLLLFLLLLPAGAEAKQPIPPLQKTDAYKRLSAYVVGLERISQATNAEKRDYTARLASLKERGYDQALLLFERRTARVKAKYRSLLDSRSNSVRRGIRADIRAVSREAKSQRKRARRDFNRNKAEIEGRYSGRLNPLEGRISRLRQKASSTNDPREKSLLLEEINLLQRKINRIRSAISKEVSRATTLYRKNLGAINDSAKKKEAILRKRAKREIAEMRKGWSRERTAALGNVEERATRDRLALRTLSSRGKAAIAAMKA